MALLSFREISTPSLPAQGEQRRFSYFNIERDNPTRSGQSANGFAPSSGHHVKKPRSESHPAPGPRKMRWANVFCAFPHTVKSSTFQQVPSNVRLTQRKSPGACRGSSSRQFVKGFA
jgi:hypothetical protein